MAFTLASDEACVYTERVNLTLRAWGAERLPDRKLFFIAGCQRSGTTLLRLMLSSHSKIKCFDEARAYPMLRGIRLRWLASVARMGDSWRGFKIPRFAEQLANTTLKDYGLEGEWRNFYRRDPILFVIRDPRDVVCSMRALKRGDANWLRHWGIPIIEYWRRNSPPFAEAFSEELEYAEHSERGEIALAALYWKYKNSAYLRYRSLGYPVAQIRYERLVSDPKTTIGEAISLLGLSWEDALLAHHQLEHSDTDAFGVAIGGTDARRPITASRVNRYSDELGLDELRVVKEVTTPLAARLGYELDVI